MPVVKYPLQSKKRGYSAAELLLKGMKNPDSVNARYVSVFNYKKMIAKDGRITVAYTTITRNPGEKTRKHKLRISARDPKYIGLICEAPKAVVTCDCVTGDTKVLTSKGWKTILSLADKRSDVINSFPITYIVNGKKYKGSVPFYKGKAKVWKLTFDNGETITATADHQLLQFTANVKTIYGKGTEYVRTREWSKVKDLKINDKICVNTVTEIADTKFDSSYWDSYFVGAFYGYGTFNPFSMEIHSHLEIIKLIKKAKVSLTHLNEGRYKIDLHGKHLLEKHGLTQSNRHNVYFDDLNVYGFLSGLIDTDGCVHADGRVDITGTEKLKEIFYKLVQIGLPGIKCVLYRKKGTRTNLGITTKDSYRLTISNKAVRLILKNMKSIKLKQKIAIYNRVARDYENVAKIVGIAYAGRQHVYDIHVPKIHRFVANSLIIHNCKRFLFKWEYALWNGGAAKLIHGNGEPPVITNPRMLIRVCKHLIVGLSHLIRNRL